MTKRSINYLIPKLTVFSIPAVFGLSFVLPPAAALGVWAGICLLLVIQNRIERRKEAEILVGIACPHCGRPA